MPLATKDGKLYFKTVTEIVDGEEVEVRKLCSSCCDDDTAGRCCVYTGYQVDQGCGETATEAEDEAGDIAANYEGGFIGEPVADPGNEDCPYACAVYNYDSDLGSVVCWDEDENGNPVTQEFCDALKTQNVKAVEFTEDEDCGEVGIDGKGTCSETPPSENRSNPLP